MSVTKTGTILEDFIISEMEESHEVLIPTSSYHTIDVAMTKDNPHSYLQSFKDVTPRDATKHITFWGRLFYTTKKFLFFLVHITRTAKI